MSTPPDPHRLPLLVLALHLLAALAAVALARRERTVRPVAAFLVLTLGADLCRLALVSLVLNPLRPADGSPFTGASSIACHVDAALFLVWPAGLAALGLEVALPNRRAWMPALGAWAACSVAVALAYPWTRGAVLGAVYGAAEGVGVAVALAALVARRPRGIAALAVALVLSAEVAGVLAGAWSSDPFTAWSLTQIQLVALFAVLAAVQGGAAWLAR